MKKKIISIVLIVCLLAATCLGAATAKKEDTVLFDKRTPIQLWYTDEALTSYVESAAYDYQEETGVKVVTVLVSGLEYLEEIYSATLENEGPDLFIISNDLLEKAYLSGLSCEIQDKEGVVNDTNYPLPALWAVSYQDKLTGYPFYYETSIFLYNQTYIENMAEAALEAEANAQEGQADMLIPSTIEEILTFAEEYDAPEQVEAVFRWDVSDIFYNYFVVGNYITVGGNAGDDPSKIQIYNENAMKCLAVYQKLNQFFSIEPKEVNYDSILQEFIEGKTVFTVATTDAIKKIEEARTSGEFAYEYKAAMLPDVNQDLQSKSLSVTNAVVINGYGNQKEKAEEFAKYLTFDRAESLYDRSGKISAGRNIDYDNENIQIAMKEYENSIPIPKMMATSNFWVQLEIAFSNIWQGSDVNETLRTLSEQIMTQVWGQEYKEEILPDPVWEEETKEEGSIVEE